MAIYFIFFIFIVALYFVLAFFRYTKELATMGGLSSEERRGADIAFSLASFVALIAIVSLRHPTMGIDLDGYLPAFKYIGQQAPMWFITDGTYQNYEYGFVVLNKLIHVISENQQFYLACCAVLAMAPIAFVVIKHSKQPLVSIVTYIGLPIFLITFSTLRQAIALGFVAISLHFVMKKKPIAFIITVLIAFLFHASALVFLVAYPIYHFKHGKTFSIITLAALPVIFILREFLFGILVKLLGKEPRLDNNGAVTLFLVFTAIYFFCIFWGDAENPSTVGLLNLFWFACVIQAFGGLYSTALRMAYYFILPLLLLLPEVFSDMKKRYVRSLFIRTAICAVCLVFFAYGLYSINASATDWPEANPYYFFWEEVPELIES